MLKSRMHCTTTLSTNQIRQGGVIKVIPQSQDSPVLLLQMGHTMTAFVLAMLITPQAAVPIPVNTKIPSSQSLKVHFHDPIVW